MPDVVGTDVLEQLMASGQVTDDTPVEQIAELMAKAEAGQALSLEPPASTEPPPVVTTPPAETKQSLETAPAATTPPVVGTPPVVEPEGPVATPSGQPIPYSVLKNTRAERDELKAENQRLQEQHQAEVQRLNQQIQAQGTPTPGQVRQAQIVANRAGLRDESGNPVDVSTVDLSQYEGQYPAEILTLLGALQARVVDLAESDAQRRAREAADTRTEEQIAIDSVPLIAEWHSAKDPTMWNAATAAYRSLMQQPEWAGKSKVEVLTEVANRFGGARATAQAPATTTTTSATPGTNVASHLAAARARSVPLSHSDLPAGSPPAQGEAEQLDSLDITQLAERFNNSTPEQQEALLARYG